MRSQKIDKTNQKLKICNTELAVGGKNGTRGRKGESKSATSTAQSSLSVANTENETILQRQ